jgi:hypothetical protein
MQLNKQFKRTIFFFFSHSLCVFVLGMYFYSEVTRIDNQRAIESAHSSLDINHTINILKNITKLFQVEIYRW